MSKAMHKGQAFISRSASFSTHGSRSGLNLLGWGEREAMSDIQKRDAALARLNQVRVELVAMKEQKAAGRVFNDSAFAQKLRLLKGEHGRLCQFLADIKRDGKQEMRHLAHYIVDVIKERVTKPEWELILKEALTRSNKAISDHAQHSAEIEGREPNEVRNVS